MRAWLPRAKGRVPGACLALALALGLALAAGDATGAGEADAIARRAPDCAIHLSIDGARWPGDASRGNASQSDPAPCVAEAVSLGGAVLSPFASSVFRATAAPARAAPPADEGPGAGLTLTVATTAAVLLGWMLSRL